MPVNKHPPRTHHPREAARATPIQNFADSQSDIYIESCIMRVTIKLNERQGALAALAPRQGIIIAFLAKSASGLKIEIAIATIALSSVISPTAD